MCLSEKSVLKLHTVKGEEYGKSRKYGSLFRHLVIIYLMVTYFKRIAISVCLKG